MCKTLITICRSLPGAFKACILLFLGGCLGDRGGVIAVQLPFSLLPSTTVAAHTAVVLTILVRLRVVQRGAEVAAVLLVRGRFIVMGNSTYQTEKIYRADAS